MNVYGTPPPNSKGTSAKAKERMTKPQLQQRNKELEAKVEALEKELDECTAEMHKFAAEVSAHHIV